MPTDNSPTARPSKGTGRPSSLQHYRVGSDPEAVPLERFLAPENLVRRWQGVADHLSTMPADRRRVAYTSWALAALNVIGWTLPPAAALTAGGMRPRSSWLDALSCLAADIVGPFDVLVSTEQIRLAGGPGTVDPSGAAGAPDPASLIDPAPLIALADDVMSALLAAGCPPGQATSGLGSCLGTLARQCGADSAEAEVARGVWAFFSPESTMPGDPAFRRPLCCGLMALAHTDAAACGDCPHR